MWVGRKRTLNARNGTSMVRGGKALQVAAAGRGWPNSPPKWWWS